MILRDAWEKIKKVFVEQPAPAPFSIPEIKKTIDKRKKDIETQMKGS